MASYQFLSLPQNATGITVVSGSSAWAYGSWTQLTGGTDTVLHLVRPMFSVTTTPTADTVLSFVFEIAIGASGSETVIAQIPYNYKTDSNVGFFQHPSEGFQGFAEMPIIPVGSIVSIRIASSFATDLTLSGVKLFYKEPLTDPYVTVTKTAAYSVPLPKTATLTDNYDDNSQDTAKWDAFNHVSETNNQLELSIVATENLYSGYTSDNFYDLTGSQSVVQLVNAGNQAITNMEIYVLYLYVNGGADGIFFYINQDTLMAYKKVASVTTSLASATYSSTNHKWFRIREASGTTYWDTSANGIDWTNFHSVANPITVTALRQETSIGTWAAAAASTTVIFDNFNLPFGVFDITKSAQYVTISQYDITKTAQYQVPHDVDVTKSAQYCVITTPADITKSSQYMVAFTPTDATFTAQYAVQVIATDITKTSGYEVVYAGTRFGYETAYGSSSSSSVDRKYASQATPSVNGTLEFITERIRLDATGSTNVRAVIYSDSSGNPDSLLATSDEVTVTNTSQKWINARFSGANRIDVYTGVYYWIGFHQQDPGTPNVVRVQSTGTTNAQVSDTDTYSDGASSTWSSPTFLNGPLSVYATITPFLDITKSVQYLVASASSDITKTAEYVVSIASTDYDITKSTSYLVATTPADKTFTALYIVISSTDIAKTAQYCVPNTPTDITKTTAYAVLFVPTDKTFTTSYAVARSTDQTNPAQYVVSSTPADIQKTAVYVVVSSVDITKVAQYQVPFARDVTNSAQYQVPSTPADKTFSTVYLVARSIDTTKSSQYTVLSTPADITKSASYVVISSQDITKTAQYQVPYAIDITKTTQYLVQFTTADRTFSAQYYVATTANTSNTASYVVLFTTDIQKTVTYVVVSSQDIAKVAQYTVPNTPADITKTAQYLVAYSPSDITKSASYLVARTTDVTKSAEYVVNTENFGEVQVSATYAVAFSSDTQKSAQYVVVSASDIQKSASYVVISSADIAKTSQYAVLITRLRNLQAQYTVPKDYDVTKQAQYAVVTTKDITKNATYAVLTTTTVTKQAQYTVVTGTDIGKPSGYSVARSTDITKLATYLVSRDSTVQVNSEYVVSLVEQELTIQVDSEYRVTTLQQITVTSEYRVGIDKIVQKLATYRVLARYPTPDKPSGIDIYSQEPLDIHSINEPLTILVQLTSQIIDVSSRNKPLEIYVSSNENKLSVQ